MKFDKDTFEKLEGQSKVIYDDESGHQRLHNVPLSCHFFRGHFGNLTGTPCTIDLYCSTVIYHKVVE